MTKLSDTQRVILSKAAQHEALLAELPAKLPAAARQSVLRSLTAKGLLEEVPALREQVALGWRQDEQGAWIALRITAAGLAAIGIVADAEEDHGERPEAADAAAPGQGESLAAVAPTPPSTNGQSPEGPQRPPASQRGGIGRGAALRIAASAVLTAWDAPVRDGLEEVIAGLRNAMASMPRQARAAARRPRSGTKQGTVLALLRREEGATIAQVMEATGWQPHTVRGFLAGLKRRITVEVLERVRQVGPDRQGAKGSYSIYRIAAPDAAASPAEAG